MCGRGSDSRPLRLREGKEIALRISLLYTGNVLATAFAVCASYSHFDFWMLSHVLQGLIAIGVFKLDQMHGIAGWQWYTHPYSSPHRTILTSLPGCSSSRES